MTENNDNLMSEFRKLQSETAGIHSNLAEKSSIDVGFLAENKVLKEILGFCVDLKERQNEQDKMCEKEFKNISLSQEKTSKDLLQELRIIREEIAKSRDVPKVERAEKNDGELAVGTVEKKVPNFDKSCVLKHTFKNVSAMEIGVRAYSDEEDHFNVPWRMFIFRNDGGFLSFYLECPRGPLWSILATFETILKSDATENYTKKVTKVFTTLNKEIGWGWANFMKFEELEKNYLKNGNLTIEINITMAKNNAFHGKALRQFNEKNKESSDVVLVVENKKFYVFKLILAAQSSYFKTLLMEDPEESIKLEVTLQGVEHAEFQMFLDVLYGENAILDCSVEIILLFASKFDAPTVIRKCENFLIEKSKKSLKKKLQMAVRYNLENLKMKCLEKISSAAEIRSVLPSDFSDLDQNIMAALFEKTLAFVE